MLFLPRSFDGRLKSLYDAAVFVDPYQVPPLIRDKYSNRVDSLQLDKWRMLGALNYARLQHTQIMK